MSFFSTGHEVVDQVGSVHLEGNVLPTNWFNTFRLENGKPDVNAVILLAEIVYWHRPTVVRDEDTGQVTSVRKKFRADLLQRSYQSFSDQFGFSKQQVKEAFDRLEQLGVIKRHFRTVEANSQKYNNVLFIELFTPVLFEMTTLSTSKGGGSTFSNGEPPHFKKGTNTETTTEITTNINTQEDPTENSEIEQWKPEPNRFLNTVRKSKGELAESVLAMPDFEFHLDAFNSYWENKIELTENQKTSKFATWLIDKFDQQKQKTDREANYQSKRTQAVKSKQVAGNNVNNAWKGKPQNDEPFHGKVVLPEGFV